MFLLVSSFYPLYITIHNIRIEFFVKKGFPICDLLVAINDNLKKGLPTSC
jgi:hypothetical protein